MSKKLLFTSKHCGSCPPMKRKLRKAGVSFREISVDNPKGDKLADKYGIRHIPNMVINGKLVNDTDKWFE